MLSVIRRQMGWLIQRLGAPTGEFMQPLENSQADIERADRLHARLRFIETRVHVIQRR